MTEYTDLLERLRGEGRTRRFREGDRLVLEGAPRGSVLVIHAGAVRVVATTLDGDEVTLAIRSTGDLIGDHSAFTDGTSRAGVVATESGECTNIPTDRFLELFGEDPALLNMQVSRLIRLLAEAEGRLVDIATLDVAARVERHLARLCEGRPLPVTIPLTQSDIASMVGASRGAVATVLADLRERGQISTGRVRITVTKIPKRS